LERAPRRRSPVWPKRVDGEAVEAQWDGKCPSCEERYYHYETVYWSDEWGQYLCEGCGT